MARYDFFLRSCYVLREETWKPLYPCHLRVLQVFSSVGAAEDQVCAGEGSFLKSTA
jgi:hypothetical protein